MMYTPFKLNYLVFFENNKLIVMATSLKMVLKMALMLIVIVGALVGNTQGIEVAQGIKADEIEHPSTNPTDIQIQKAKCCVYEPICCRIGLRNLKI